MSVDAAAAQSAAARLAVQTRIAAGRTRGKPAFFACCRVNTRECLNRSAIFRTLLGESLFFLQNHGSRASRSVGPASEVSAPGCFPSSEGSPFDARFAGKGTGISGALSSEAKCGWNPPACHFRKG